MKQADTQAVEAIRLAAEESMNRSAVDTTTYARIVLVGLARPAGSLVLAIDRAEWERVNRS